MKTLGNLLVGARVFDPNTKYYGVPIVWRIMEHNHEGDPENSTAVISDKVLCLKAFDAREPKYAGSSSSNNSNIQKYGNANYALSNILQWANSDADAWMWYAPQHEYDHSPDTTDYVTANTYESEAGFLKGFSSGFKENMLDVTKKIGTEVTRKIHLPTLTELAGDDSYSEDDSSIKPYELFSDDASRKAEITEESKKKDEGSFDSYWTATTYSVYEVRCVYKSGKAIYESSYVASNRKKAYDGQYNGFRPYCCLNSDIIVSDKPDENGVYTLFLKSKPDKPVDPDNPDEPINPDYPDSPMDGKWRTPKTDWAETDAFNLKDYKRIRNNLLFLRNRMSYIWVEFSIQDMGNDPTDPKYIWKVRYFNAIEENLETINKRMIIVKNYGFKQTFYNNGAFIGFSELNRIESATLQMKQIIDGWQAGLRRLSFRLGAPKGLYL